jgi:putative ABC transport system permease protein
MGEESMWLLAIKAMLADRGKLLTSLLGVAFSVVLVNLQGGLLLGMIQKASLLVDYGQADIWVGHQHMTNVDMGTFIPERWIHRIRGIDGVEKAEPYVVMFGQATMPDGRFENVVVVGSQPSSLMGNAWVMDDGDPSAVRRPDGILVDVCDRDRLGNPQIGDIREINGQRARIVGMTSGIVSFTTNPYIFTTLDRARHRYALGVPADGCSYFLIKAKPGFDPKELSQRIRERVPELDAYDRRTYSWMCMEYWLTRTGIGISFGLAAFLGLLVGLAVVAQTLYASVNERIKEFGTLKALGADDPRIARFLLAQSMATAFLGSVLGLGCSWFIGRVMSTPRAPVMLTYPVAAGSVVLIVLVCLIATWVPYWRIRRIDPASVLRN